MSVCVQVVHMGGESERQSDASENSPLTPSREAKTGLAGLPPPVLGFGVGAYLKAIPGGGGGSRRTSIMDGNPTPSLVAPASPLLLVKQRSQSTKSQGSPATPMLESSLSLSHSTSSRMSLISLQARQQSDGTDAANKQTLQTELREVAMLHGRDTSVNEMTSLVHQAGLSSNSIDVKKIAEDEDVSLLGSTEPRTRSVSQATMKKAISVAKILDVQPTGKRTTMEMFTDHLTYIVSGAMNSILLLVFAVVFGYIAFEDENLEQHRVLGVQVHFVALVFSTFLTARFSPLRSSIGGVDVNSALTYAVCGRIVAKHVTDNEHDVREILPSFLLVICLGTVLVGTTMWVLSHFRATALIHFWPASVLSGFLAGVGFNVMKEAVFVTTGVHASFAGIPEILEWDNSRMVLVAVPIGFGLYFLKRLRYSALYVVPTFTLVPVAFFYIALALSGRPMDELREDNWLFPDIDEKDYSFYSYYDEFYGALKFVNLEAVGLCIPELLVMVVIITIDFSLKLSGTEKELECNRDFHSEFRMTGLINLVSSVFGAAPSYDQMKFTLINAKITGDAMNPIPGTHCMCMWVNMYMYIPLFMPLSQTYIHTRVLGYICGVVSTVVFFISYPIADYLPRFYLAGLVFYAG
jgi:hypothetical protein